MGKLRTETVVETAPETHVDLQCSPKVLTQVRTQVTTLKKLKVQKDEIDARIEKAKNAIEVALVEDGHYDALVAGGAGFDSPLGRVGVKTHTGQTTKTLNKKKLMKKHGLTQKDLDACTDETPKAEYFQVYLPK